jgi:GAF domain-containing protein
MTASSYNLWHPLEAGMSTNALIPQRRNLLKTDDDTRKVGSLGRIPYVLVLRWFTALGIFLRFFLHQAEYAGRLEQITVSIGAAFALALLLTFRPLRQERRFHKIEVVAIILADIIIISSVYLATHRLQSDTFLFFFLPLILAAEYLPGRWIVPASIVLTLAFWGIMTELQPVDQEAHMTLWQAFLRVYLGREFFLLGFVVTAWYLFRVERAQKRRLERNREETLVLFDFSLKLDQIFQPEDLVQEAVRCAAKALHAEWVIGIYYGGDGVPQILYYPAEPEAATKRLAHRLAEAANNPDDSLGDGKIENRPDRAIECLELGKRKLGFLAVGSPGGTVLGSQAGAFLKTLSGSLMNGLRRTELISSLRAINRETLKTLEFDQVLDEILRRATEGLHLDFAAITLKDDYRGVVETVRGRNVPPGLLRLSRYPLKKRDIQTFVVKSGQTVIIDKYRRILNKEIFDRFEHGKLARIWVPIRNGAAIIGTIEAGCAKARRVEALTPEVCAALEQLGSEKGPGLATLHPQALLTRFAREAIRLIGADSASIHIFVAPQPLSEERIQSLSKEDLAAHFRDTNPALVAGAGRADAEFIRLHAPRSGGMGWEAMLATLQLDPSSYRVIDREDELQSRNPEIHKAGVRAILAVPLRISPEAVGVLYVHYWRAEEFSQQAIQIERVFGAQIEVALHSHLLLRSTAEAIQSSLNLLEWLKVIQSPGVLKDSRPVLEELAKRLLLVADADNVVLYQYVEDRKVFVAPPIRDGMFIDKDAMLTTVEPWHLVYQLVGKPLPRFYEDLPEEWPDAVIPSRGKRRFADREGIRSSAVLELRAREELFGTLFVNYRNRRVFTPELRVTMEALAASAANVIRLARYYAWMTARDKQLDTLRQVDRAILESARSLSVAGFLDVILTEAVQFSGAASGAVYRPVSGDELEAVAHYPSDKPVGRCRAGEGATGRCAASRAIDYAVRRNDSEEGWISERGRSQVAIPITADPGSDELVGVLLLESDEEEAFSKEDFAVFQNLATQAVIGVHSIERYLNLKQEQELAGGISAVAGRIPNVEYSLELIIYQILTAITAPESVGFSRAMLFVREEHGAVLQGFSAVGESSYSEAHRTWERLTPQSILEALDNSVEHFQAVKRGERKNPFLDAIRNVSIPLSETECAIAQCAASRSNAPVVIGGGRPDPFRDRMAAATGQSYEGVSFACVPLLGRDETIGVLVVDERFKTGVEGRAISEAGIGRLRAHAEMAAMSIENSRLLEKTQTQTYDDMAHQLRGPLALASDYCETIMSDPAWEGNADMVKLKAAVGRALHISMSLRQYANLARGRPIVVTERLTADAAVRLVQGSVDNFKALVDPDKELRFEIRKDGFAELNEVPIKANLDLLREALENLLDNAMKYSYRNTAIEVLAEFTLETRGFLLVVANTGMPIEADQLEQIKERGHRGLQSSAVTGEGAGIGLFLADGIMTAHGGRLIPEATTTHGLTRVGLWFPATVERIEKT